VGPRVVVDTPFFLSPVALIPANAPLPFWHCVFPPRSNAHSRMGTGSSSQPRSRHTAAIALLGFFFWRASDITSPPQTCMCAGAVPYWRCVSSAAKRIQNSTLSRRSMYTVWTHIPSTYDVVRLSTARPFLSAARRRPEPPGHSPGAQADRLEHHR
jgi:hypothetical protein